MRTTPEWWRFKEAFEAKTNGVIHYGRVVKRLKDVSGKATSDELFAAFQRYISATDARYLSIERFCETLGAWLQKKEEQVKDPFSD